VIRRIHSIIPPPIGLSPDRVILSLPIARGVVHVEFTIRIGVFKSHLFSARLEAVSILVFDFVIEPTGAGMLRRGVTTTKKNITFDYLFPLSFFFRLLL
jgi:hypothetical protein